MILSQCRRKLINFKNIDTIAENSYTILAFNGDQCTCLGEYKSEKRRKEIIVDICEQYTRFLNFPGAEGNAVFQMPKE